MANIEVDFLGCITHNNFECLNIYGPMNVGKTSYLDALRKYHSTLAENDSDSDDKHFTISLDFSDFVAIAYIDAINYFRKKMSELYLQMYENVKEELHHFETLSGYLDMIEGVSDEERLKNSLVNMVRFLRYGRRYNEYYYRPLILIDEISRPLLYASKYGYLKEMTEFYDTFLDIDHYEMTAGIVATSYAPVNIDVHFNLKYIHDVPANQYESMKAVGRNNGIELVEPHRVINYWRGDRYFDELISLEECFDELIKDKTFSEPTLGMYEVELSSDIRSFVNTKRIWITNERLAYEAAEKKRREREKTEYAQPLASGFGIPSAFAGMRELDIGIGDSEEYYKLNSLLKKLYVKHKKGTGSRNVYNEIQHIGDYYENVKEVRNTLEKLKEYADSKECFYRCWIDVNDSYWAKFDFQRFENDNGYRDMALVKTYISVSESSEVLNVFNDVIRFLIDNGNHLFHAKTSIRQRDDHICLWLAREDFFLLEEYMKKYDEILVKPLDFVAYRGKLGITREFHSWSSHNGFISELISIYLDSVEAEDEIDVIKMFSTFVKAWNGDMDDDNAFSREYRGSNAQEMIIMLESLNITLGNERLDDNNILLSGDGDMWCALGESKNWYQVGIRLKRLERTRRERTRQSA